MHEAFIQEKRERNVVDFNDLEQLALSILLRWEEERKEYVRTEAACELAEHFVEIMIDEYQDSNRVQDTLLRSVSREGLPEYSWPPKCAATRRKFPPPEAPDNNRRFRLYAVHNMQARPTHGRGA